jgi:hypothetical protein
MSRKTAIILVVAAISLLVSVTPALASFGFEHFEGGAFNQDGSTDTQAGSHPWALRTSFNLNVNEGVPDGDLKDIEVQLPAGLSGNPAATPKCTAAEFSTPNPNIFLSGANCPDNTQVGVGIIGRIAGFPVRGIALGIYNLVPPAGAPAEFGFNPAGVPIVLTPKVRTGGDYGLTVDVNNTNEALRIFGAQTMLWGVPADSSHDEFRGECLTFLGFSSCSPEARAEEAAEGEPEKLPRKAGITPVPFLTLPTTCSGEELLTSIRADSWETAFNADGSQNLSESRWVSAPAAKSPPLTGCDRLDSSPSISVAPESSRASTPTGLQTVVTSPVIDNPAGLGEANLKKVVVQLPVGMTVNPAAADGLQACSPEAIGINSAAAPTCPEGSKVGSVEIVTPILEAPLKGSVYLAQQNANPFNSLLALYVVAEADGVLIKLAGHIEADPTTGQLTTTFDNNPQQPFSELKLNLFGGPRAALVTPAACGEYQVNSSLTPWSSEDATTSSSRFSITECGGGFAPTFAAGTVDNQAGGYSPFSLTISRSDFDQALGGITVHTPPGLLGMLSKVALCGEPQAAQGTCSSASQIGHTVVGAGAGPSPVFLPQAGKPQDPVFLTGPYKGAPFGLSVVVPAEAGPFSLGTEVVRAAINVDRNTSQLTITTDPLPTILQGIPLQVRTINVSVDRPEFMFNPTSCEPLSVTGTITSTQGTNVGVSSPFRAANCAKLAFKPKFTVSTQGKTSRKKGASLDVKVAYPKGAQANIHKVAVDLPKQLPSRLTTIQKACPSATFDANPASCPAGSNVGSAKASTPVLNVPLTGPAYLVSHGGEAFPDLVVILQGQGVTVYLTGAINIRGAITSSTFGSVPDVPISSFELKLPEGPHSALTSNLPAKAKGNLCASSLVMPTTIVGQNGAQIKQSTKITITGCPKRHKAKAPKKKSTAKKRK